MIKVKVEIPFHLKDTKKDYVPNDIIEVTEETLSRIRAVNINMVSVVAKEENAASVSAPVPKKKSGSGTKKKSGAE